MKPPKPEKPAHYAVGYGKPPKHTQFKKGESGNVKGRPKQSLNVERELESALGKLVAATENGIATKRTKFKLMLEVNINKALKGDPRAFNNIMALMARTGIGEAETDPAETFTNDDAEAFDRFLTHYTAGRRHDNEAA